jgi:protein TIF31
VPYTIIDFKGERLVGQGMIPGILVPQGDNSASLMYGVLEKGKNLTVKNSSLSLLENFKKFHIPIRSLQRNPFPDFILGENGDVVEENSPSIKVDTVDDVVSDNTSVIPHIGPLELKLLKGSDSRIYALETVRLTPRDANYVKCSKGTSLIDKKFLDRVDEDICFAYVLRRELISLYIDHSIQVKRQEMLAEFAKSHIESTEKKIETSEEEIPAVAGIKNILQNFEMIN